jgi:hypothetical protein
MAYPYGPSVSSSAVSQFEELAQNNALILDDIQKEITACGVDLKLLGDLIALRMACGQTIDEEQAPLPDDAQHAVHLLAPGREPGAHVVVDADGKRDVGEVFPHDPGDPMGPIAHEKGPGPWIDSRITGFHGLVKHDFVAPRVNLVSQIIRGPELRQDRKGHGNAQLQELLGPAGAMADIIND